MPESTPVVPPSRRGPYRHTRARREKIIDAALQVFSRSGYHSASLREIADLAEVSEGGLLHHFPTKATLLGAVLEHRDARARAIIGSTDASGQSVLDGLVALAADNAATPGLAQLHVTLSLEAPDPTHPAHAYFASRHVESHALVEHALIDLSRQSRLRSGITPQDGAVLILAAMDGLQLQWLQHPDGVDMARLLRLAIDGVVAPMTPGSADPP